MREIEVKVRVADVTAVLSAAAEANILFGPAKKQADVIFCWPGVPDYQPGSVWLRIRTENESKITFTLKRDNGRKLDSIEYELEISDAQQMELAVLAMGYEEYARLTKVRRRAMLGNIELCLDEVDNLGTFLEAEMLTDKNVDHKKITQELWSVLRILGLQRTSEVTDAYDVLLHKAGVHKA